MTVTTRFTNLALAVAAATGLALHALTPAVAAPPRGPDSAVSAPTPYAEPLASVEGRTLAQYLADHHAGGPAGDGVS